MIRMTSLRRIASRWRRIALRALGGLALSVLVVTAAAALLDPPAEAGGLAAPAPANRGRRAAGGTPVATQPARASPVHPDHPGAGGPPRALLGLLPPCAKPGLVAGVLNLNTANQSELEALPGIGPAKARRILEWRARHGGFRRIRDLRRVRGFGRKTVLHLARYLRLEGATTLRGRGVH